MENKLKIGFVGLGQRGNGLMTNVLVNDEVVITALCDIYEDRIEKAAARVTEKGDPEPLKTTDYKSLVDSGVDVVIVSTGWSNHVLVALYAMEKGVTIAMEVGGTHSIDDCWKLVDAYERTKTPFMFLENCCYNKDEALATSLVRNGVLGNISFCQGYYCHDLREEIAGGIDTHHYRLQEYTEHNCENYPTHELGPIAKILNINGGNRFVSLVSMSSKSQGMREYIAKTDKYTGRLGDRVFNQGDVVTTMIKCENGETIFLKLDTTLPRLYERRDGQRHERILLSDDQRRNSRRRQIQSRGRYLSKRLRQCGRIRIRLSGRRLEKHHARRDRTRARRHGLYHAQTVFPRRPRG